MVFGMTVVLSHKGAALRVGLGLALVGAIVGLVSALGLDRPSDEDMRHTI